MSEQASVMPGGCDQTFRIFPPTYLPCTCNPYVPRESKVVEVKVGWLDSLQQYLGDLTVELGESSSDTDQQDFSEWIDVLTQIRNEARFYTRFV